MSQRSFASRTARPALILGVSAAILSLGLSACVPSYGPRSSSPNPARTSSSGRNPSAPSKPATGTIYFADLEVGHCFQDWTEGDTQLLAVDCSSPHDNEVYYVAELTDDDLPSENDLENRSLGLCLASFEPYVGALVDETTLDYGWLFPSDESWSEGDRDIVCYLFAKDGSKLNQSAQNSY
ncbi:MAG: septum formation family protein [Rothia mucilaginosa]|uniref:septum formation family protein n=1 Tax=Rothia mucilaginosa TaxID=43675 RepID=UPI0026ED34F0|nr:septum formation family protein [Rothia mucilaginosa]MBS5103017.1 septum formation family protein [Rothia mucilaginosa]